MLLCLCAMSEAKEAEKSITVTPIENDADAANNGVIYSLPATALRIRVDAEMTVETVGPYYKYSNKYLNLSDVITENKTTWKIANVSIDTYGVANSDRQYKISTSGNAALPAISLANDGVLLGLNIAKPNEKKDRPHEKPKKEQSTSFDGIPLEREILMKTSTAAMAEEAANAIYRLRQKRLSLLGGEDAIVLNDEGSYKRVLNELDKLEAEYVSLFAGIRQKVKVTRYFTVIPDPNGVKSNVLLRFSEKDGFLDVMDLNGKPVYIDVTFEKKKSINELSSTSKQRASSPLTGLRYIVPGTVNVKIVDRNILLLEKDIPCSQNGQVLTLPASVLLSETVKIELDPSNGSLKSISY